MYGSSYDSRMVHYPRRVRLLMLTQWLEEWGFNTVAVSTPGIPIFVPGVLGLNMYERSSDPGMGPYPSRVALGHAGSTVKTYHFPRRGWKV